MGQVLKDIANLSMSLEEADSFYQKGIQEGLYET